MATLSELTFDGGTAGNAVAESGWENVGSAVVYNADAAHGAMAMRIGNSAYGDLRYEDVGGISAFRLRTYLKHTGTSTGNHFMMSCYNGDSTYRGGVHWRGSNTLRCRWLFQTGQDYTGFTAAAGYRRVDFEYLGPSTTGGWKVYIYDPADDTSIVSTLQDNTDANGFTQIRLGTDTGGGLYWHYDSVKLTEGEDPGPYNAATPVPGVADYDLSVAAPQNTTARSGWVYTLDTTGSTGATTLVWDGASRGTITESPTGVFSITDPDDGDAALALVLTAAGVDGGADDVVNLSIPRGGAATRPKTLTFVGPTWGDRASWK